jgi:CheY-like chemotaxis protein
MSAAARDPHEMRLASLAGARVLVTGGSETSRANLARQLETWEVTVGIVPDGASALDALRNAAQMRTPFDVVLLESADDETTDADLERAIEGDPSLVPSRLIVLNRDELPPSAAATGGGGGHPIQPLLLYGALARALDSQPSSPEVDEHSELPGGARVLVADDEIADRMIAVSLLERRGFRVDIAINGREAVEMHKLMPYDAIFMDCMMPVLDGREATAEIREHDGAARHTPIVGTTAHATTEEVRRSLAAGMDYCIEKPIRSGELDRVIAQAVSKLESSWARR